MSTLDHTTRAHARFSPSGASRWVNCPGSIALSAPFKDTSSIYADEGTAAHELAQLCWDRGHDAARYTGWFVNLGESKPLNKLKIGARSHEVSEEMAEGVDVYLDMLKGYANEGAEVEVEQRIDLRFIAEDMWGTGDGLAYKPAEQHLYVCDFKFGAGVAVEVDDNSQLSTYALGAAKRYHNRGVKKISLVIVQPRAFHKDGPVRVYETSLLDVLGFGNVLKSAVETALGDTPPVKAGEWCQWCKAKPVCPALKQAAQHIVDEAFEEEIPNPPEVRELSPEAIGRKLAQVSVVKTWIKGLQTYAFEMAKAGRPPHGYKVVENQARRRWTDPEAVSRHLLGTGCDRVDVFTEKIKSPNQIERTLGKSTYGEVAEYVTKKSSGVVLAPESDKRPAVSLDADTEFSEE